MNEELQVILDNLDETKLVELLIESVEEYSPSFAEEPAMEVFAARLGESGISYLRQPVAEAGGPTADHRANLIIELGPQPASFMWVGHVDTVPIVDEEEQRIHREGDILHGLGTADMKSGCAAMVEAVVAIVKSGVKLKRGFTVALVVGEEETGDGSEALLASRTAPLTVIGEPTGLLACVDHYSYYECRLRVRGTRAHAALPEIGASAIHAMLEWMRHILEIGSERYFSRGLSVNTREINGGAGHFMVAEQCEAVINIHAPPDMPIATIEELIDETRLKALATHPGLCAGFRKSVLGRRLQQPGRRPAARTSASRLHGCGARLATHCLPFPLRWQSVSSEGVHHGDLWPGPSGSRPYSGRTCLPATDAAGGTAVCRDDL